MRGKNKTSRLAALSLLLALTFALCGCGSGGGEADDTVSMYDLRKAMEAADTSLPEMTNLSKNDAETDENIDNTENSKSGGVEHLFNTYIAKDLDYNKVDDFFVSYAVDGGNADEIVVIAVKDKKDIDEAKAALEDHRESRRKNYEQYEPEQVKRVENGLLFTEKQYAVLIICDNPDGVRKAFEGAIQ
jgi:hypothetical protein